MLTGINKTYRVAGYIRLSQEDDDKVANVGQSLSVINQRNLLIDYVKKQGYEMTDIYIDDGFTGTNFDRPAFKKMIKDLELGKANMVVTKDLSRLGRDYIETGHYIEKYFPTHNIRYVSILDDIDTELSTSNNDIAPFKAVINDMYSRDNSKKIRTALMSMKLKGKWVGGCTPLGYKPDPNDKNHLIIDNSESWIVKKIFQYAMLGYTYCQIKDKLIEENVPTMSMLRLKHINTPMANRGIWCSKTVKSILSNELYLGNMIQNKRRRISHKVRKIINNEKESWIIVHGTHEAIIEEDSFNNVQKILSNCKIKPKKEIYRILDGLLYCYDCKHKISICKPRKSNGITYICCNYYRMYSKQKLCTSHSFNYDKLELKIIGYIRQLFVAFIDIDKFKKRAKQIYMNSFSGNELIYKRGLIENSIKLKLEQLDKMYLDKLDGIVTQEMYDRIKAKIDYEIGKLKLEQLDLLDSHTQHKSSAELDNECNNLIKDFLSTKKITRSEMLKLIKKIEIKKDKAVDIYFTFKNL